MSDALASGDLGQWCVVVARYRAGLMAGVICGEVFVE
ncbi:hypothetical protein BWQ96_08557 [Gracilariopsis chorda]|uniref:Uncharacterized protein n=1 Tax=Gracilariopsis chorda TaxID=448386 RepID=A0A2V3II18_9FLOR|nr:hypothetical protein BWQ96_08557 [Gracilariopsis chorda]|eukprot:PXF41727.1 hypothetical protein BWQ96_08557 [Gracilariopsis chorda]